jgi:predicted alpha/beta-hydrolase family hydrolase
MVGPSPRSGEAETPPEAEAGVGRGRDSSEVEVEAELWGRARRRPPSEAEVEAEPWGRARRRPPSEAEAQGRARRSFLLRLRLNLAVVSLTLVGGTTVGVRQAALFSCQVGQWKGEVTAVTSTLPTEARVSG